MRRIDREIGWRISENTEIIAASAFCFVLMIAGFGVGGVLGAAIATLGIGVLSYVVLPYAIFVEGVGVR